MCVGFRFHLDDSAQKAMRAVRPYFEENIKMFAPLGLMRGMTDDQIRSLAGPSSAPILGLPTIEAAANEREWLCGTPEEVIAHLKEFEERYPRMEHVYVASVLGTPGAVMVEQLEWFAREVMPAFLPRPVGADGGGAAT